MSDENNYLQSIGNNIRKLRNAKNLSQQELADHSNIAKSTIQRIENGTLNPTILILDKICKSLDVSLDELVNSDPK